MSIIGDIVDHVLRGAVTKAVQGFVAKGDITPAQVPTLVEGIMLEVQIALDVYNQSQKGN